MYSVEERLNVINVNLFIVIPSGATIYIYTIVFIEEAGIYLILHIRRYGCPKSFFFQTTYFDFIQRFYLCNHIFFIDILWVWMKICMQIIGTTL